MGCQTSAPVHPSSSRTSPSPSSVKSHRSPDASRTADSTHPIRDSCSTLISRLSRLPRPELICATVALSESSIPLVTGSVALDGGDVSLVQLPAAAIAQHEHGNLACMGSIEMLSLLNPEVAEYLAFLERLLEFLSKVHGKTFSVLI
jgi:hypothetical protein